ncbi:MAG TPA: PepSY domain-containing protein [Candidatus Limnocylindrales bacterium]|nr:PepSY domain-containing protein [Candidatus Limnocylindrales bacterium]
MPSFDKINRRAHLYLGLLLMPWLLMYGLSSFIIIHQSWFGANKEQAWEPLFEKQYSRLVPESGDLRDTAQAILKDCNLEGAFWADKPNPDTLRIDRFSFWDSTRLLYSIKEQKLQAQRQRMHLSQAVIRMHFRGGYGQPTVRDKFWGFLVDLACIGIIIWVASGLLMWWRLPRLRNWGAVAVGGGILSFLVLIWTI